MAERTTGSWEYCEIPALAESFNDLESFDIDLDYLDHCTIGEIRIKEDDGTVIAKIVQKIRDERIEVKEARANAVLITAAPDILDALIESRDELYKWFDYAPDDKCLPRILTKIEKALLKAGEYS
jgi:hypothetical protein